MTVGRRNVSAYLITGLYDGILLLNWGYACRQYSMTHIINNTNLLQCRPRDENYLCPSEASISMGQRPVGITVLVQYGTVTVCHGKSPTGHCMTLVPSIPLLYHSKGLKTTWPVLNKTLWQ